MRVAVAAACWAVASSAGAQTSSPPPTPQINLSWADNSSNEAGFKLQRSPDGINFTLIATLGANVTTYLDTGLTASTDYYYRVRSYNSGGSSAFSNTVKGTAIGLTNRIETEALKVESITPVPSGYTSAQWFGVFSASAASGGAGTYFNAIAPGNYVKYTVPVAKAGTYRVRIGIKTKRNKGIWQLAINGLNLGQPQDEYYPSITYGVRDLSIASFSVAGNYAFKFTVKGKNASSTGYTLGFDYIELVPQ